MSGKRDELLVVLGMMGRTPFAGVAWQVLHYLEGFRRLGYDVYYVEDTGDWAYDPEQNSITADPTYTVSYIARLMEWCSQGGRWAYRSAAQDNCLFGLSEERVSRLFEEASVLVNLTGATVLREEHLQVPVRIYLETDPVLPQIEVAQGNRFTIEMLSAHTHHFTYGENLGAPDCLVPTGRFSYRPTRQPVVLDWWLPPVPGRQPHASHFTTIASWRQSGKDVEWGGELYTWSKHHEFLKFIDLPRRTSQPLELALACDDHEALTLLRAHGWRVVDALALSKSIFPYRDYIATSHGEFTVAKDQNVRLRSGWFSDRSASYLASGRPVITQDTAFGNILPTGEGLFAFNTMDDIVVALDAISSNYERHSRAALDIAEQYFKAETVLARMMDDLEL
ncbi:MAG: hypothetical protein M3328_17665 [Chloroflexota bacterium]|nr:hypothetical protein [Chloroflexota bacterium]